MSRPLHRPAIYVLLALVLVGCGTETQSRAQAPDISSGDPPSATVASVAAAPITVCPDAKGPITGPIVFGGGNTLLAMKEDGSGVQTLIDVPPTGLAHQPAWKPDGSMLAYTLVGPSADPSLPGLQVGMICAVERADGKGQLLARAAAPLDSLEEPAWTPDGRAVLVTMRQTKLDEKKRYIGDTTSVARFDLLSGKMQTLIEKASSPTISPDGKQLATIAVDQMRSVLVLASADGQDARIIAKTEPMFDVLAAPQWSPDGTRLLFTAAGGPRPAGAAASPALTWIEWALGIRVAAAHGAPADIWVVDASGQNPLNLTKKQLDDPRGAWSPDSKQILFTAGQAGGVYLLDPATTQAKQLTTQGDFGGIDWASR